MLCEIWHLDLQDHMLQYMQGGEPGDEAACLCSLIDLGLPNIYTPGDI